MGQLLYIDFFYNPVRVCTIFNFLWQKEKKVWLAVIKVPF